MGAGANNPAYRHGHTTGGFSPEYHSWASMIQRCTNPKRPYWKHYGGKGVRVCERWMSFENFLADMGARPAGTSLDRINLDGDYEPSNCRWADAVTQARNASHVTHVVIDGVDQTLRKWCEAFGISINTVRDRVKFHGMTYEEALLRPVQSAPFTKVVS